jgi:hypothetical protein
MDSSEQHQLPGSEMEEHAAVPKTFAEAVEVVTQLILADFDREIAQKQLYYHTRDHVFSVQRNARLIFNAIRPYLSATPDEIDRLELLVNLCAIAHDAIQLFTPSEAHTSRRREAGVSEQKTIEKLGDYIHSLNQTVAASNPESSALFTAAEIGIIEEAIEATICAYDVTEQAIYQPSLYPENSPISVVTRSIALADIGSLGIEGIATYNHEGSLLFLEENPDIIPILKTQTLTKLASEEPDLHENIRQRLLRRTGFQVSFAKSRFNRLSQELTGFPEAAIPKLTQDVFQYLTPQTIQEVIEKTPTDADTPLEQLIQFFGFESILGL